MNLKISIINYTQIVDIVEVHYNALPDDLLPLFGKFIMEEYYKNAIRLNDGFIIGAWDNSRLIGFVYLSEGKNSFFKLLNQRCFLKLLLASSKIAIQKPIRAISIFKSLFSGNEYHKFDCQIAYIAVDKEYQGLGIGSLLLESVSNISLKKNILSCFTKTLTENLHVIKMYKKLFPDAEVYKEFSDFKRNYSIIGWSFKLF
jgi:ribosomal protein S18 acetylase RimI-like enzyme